MNTPAPWQIDSLFERFPALCGFSVRGLDEVPDHYPRGEEPGELFVGDIGIAPALSAAQFQEIFEGIVVTLAELLAEAPEAGERLRGRTFARVLH